MKEILIVYIATGKYIKHISYFLNSLTNFCPGVKKHVAILTDDSNNSHYIGRWKLGEISSSKRHIDHLPWPLVTLLKFHYIKQMIDKYPKIYSHVCYFNANVVFNNVVTYEEFFGENQITFVNHWTGGKNSELGNKVKNSSCYIDEDYDYVQADVFGGPINNIIDECDWVIKHVNFDLARRVIPSWDDESYHNYYYWKILQPEQVKLLSHKQYNCYNAEGEYTEDNKIILRNSDFTEIDKDPYHIK